MAVLGKRSRRSLDATSPSSDSTSLTPRSTRAKRRAVEDSTTTFVIANDENENPFVTTRSTRKRTRQEGAAEVDELSLECPPLKKLSTAGTVPAKHGVPETRIAHSTAKVDSAPSTPRHRDRDVAKKIAITPRHRTGLLGRPLTPHSIRSPSTPRQIQSSVYNDARKLFKGSVNSGKIIGRDEEKTELASFISKRLQTKSSGCIYVSGPPGTGKSALVKEVCDELKDTYTVEASYYSCVSAKCASDIYAKLLDDFGVVDVMEGAEIPKLKDLFQARAEPYLVILDEIDHLLDVDLELLYQLFEWSLQKTSSLILVGIANALDLTDRFLPRLKSKGLKPVLLPFMPYTVAQIASVVSSKLNGLLPHDSLTPEFVPLIHPTAILFASKKVAAQTGDIRKAFAVCLRALDLIEAETRATLTKSTSELTPSSSPSPSKTPLMENINLSSPSISHSPRKNIKTMNTLGHLKFETAPRATIAHMARVTASVFSNGLSQRLSSLNLQQKAALCALSALETKRQERQDSARAAPTTPSKSSSSAPTVRMLYENYSRLCKRDNVLQPLALTEFRDIVVSLETLSVISWADSKNGSLAAASAGTPSRRGRGKSSGFGVTGVEDQKVVSCVGVKELKASLNGPGSGVLLAIVDGQGF